MLISWSAECISRYGVSILSERIHTFTFAYWFEQKESFWKSLRKRVFQQSCRVWREHLFRKSSFIWCHSGGKYRFYDHSRVPSVTNSRLLVIFSKNPVKGEVKTRLAQSIGDKKALEVYETLREHTARVTECVDAERMVYYSSFIPSSDLFGTENFLPRLQKGDDLGERMFYAMKEGFEAGFAHVVLIGTDCDELSSQILNEAFSALTRYEAVIGPATDGGFYLIGLNRVLPELFFERQWSTPEVFGETITRLQRLAIEYERLTELSDIDTFEDLKKSTLWPLQS